MYAVIPARSGSKGIVNKNIQMVGGRSLVDWSVQCALRAGFTPVVSSDSAHIFEHAECIRRPPEISGDDAVTQDAVLHALKELDNTYPFVLMLQCTTPFTKPERLHQCADFVVNGQANWALTCAPFKDFVVQGGTTCTPEYWVRRQEMRQRYVITGGCYCYRVCDLPRWRELYYEPFKVVETDKYEGWNIDELEDLILARQIADAGIAGQWLLSP